MPVRNRNMTRDAAQKVKMFSFDVSAAADTLHLLYDPTRNIVVQGIAGVVTEAIAETTTSSISVGLIDTSADATAVASGVTLTSEAAIGTAVTLCTTPFVLTAGTVLTAVHVQDSDSAGEVCGSVRWVYEDAFLEPPVLSVE